MQVIDSMEDEEKLISEGALKAEKDFDYGIEEKKRKIKSFLKDKYNAGLVFVLLTAFFVRAYFLYVAKDQAHWWDSLAYGGIAKNMIFGLWDDIWFVISESLIRPPLLPLIWSSLLRINFSDFGILILVEFIPSLLSVLLIYLIGEELYDKRVGLISAFIASVIWIHLFYSVRIMTDTPSLFFALASIYFFVKCYENMNLKHFSLSIFFLSLAILMRYSYGLIGFVYLIYLGFIYRHKILLKKNFWAGGIIGSIPLLIFFGNNVFKYGSLFPAVGEYAAAAAEKPFAFYVIGFIPYIMKSALTGAFLIGLALILFELFLGFDSINKIKRLRSHLFLVVLLIVSLVFFLFIIKAAEDRYLMMLFPSLFAFSSIGFVWAYNFLGKYSKVLAFLLVIGVLLFGVYSQLSFGKMIIENKKTSYLPMKEAFLWINENTPEDSLIIGQWADPYTIYYAERRVESWPKDLDNLNDFIPESDYLVVNGVHPPDERVVSYIENNLQGKLTMVKVFYFDDAGTQPAVIIYKIEK